MAASGINEHNEARRKEAVLLKQAKWKKHLQSMPDSQYAGQQAYSNNAGHGAACNSYERELDSRAQCRVVGSPPGIDTHGARAVDKQRRMDHYNQQQAEYSAKIKGRYRNFDYISQW
ncbi:uncharacterized protein [Watersipora subatra]|uniref:uncharacterized protein n=1 Tax=Watersipora subatra TaxID=2589382 RepID=UPI00355C5C30